MTVTKNGGYVEDLANDATIGQIEAVKHKASAIQVDARETAAYEEKEVTKQEGAKTEARHKEAGASQSTKLAEGTPEGRVAAEGITQMAPAASIAANLMEGLQEAKSNPSQGAGAAKIRKASLASPHAKSFEDGFKAMKKAPIKTPFGRSLTEKGGALSASFQSLSNDTKGVRESGVGTESLKTTTGEVKKGLTINKSLANEAKLGRANHLENTAAPSPGMGSGQSQQPQNSMNTLALNKMAPKPPSDLPTEGENWAG